MKQKSYFHLMGWATLIGFPAIGYTLLWLFEDYTFQDFTNRLEFGNFFNSINLIGLELGFAYAFLVIFISQSAFFKEITQQQNELLKNLDLNLADALFISFCAGFGEEILFRVSLQTWLAPWLTTFIFVAIHGYFSIKILKKNAVGLLVFPFILLISFGYEIFGFWFAVAAHFSYDLLMFIFVVYKKQLS